MPVNYERCVENAFGILCYRWRLFRRPLGEELKPTQVMVAAVCALHNLLAQDTSQAEQFYCPLGYADSINADGDITARGWRKNKDSPALFKLKTTLVKNLFEVAKSTRALYKCYFMTPAGKVPWQHKCPGVSKEYREFKEGHMAR